MKKTRHAGVYKLKNGRFKLIISVTHPRTKKRLYQRKTLPEGTTLKQALSIRDNLKQKLLAQDVEPTRQRTTLSGYAKTWIETKKRRLKPRAYTTYYSALANHILPSMGDLYVDAIIRSDVEEWVVEVENAVMHNGEPYSSATLKGWWRVLKLLLQDAAADFGIPDPTARIRPPETYQAPKREKATLTSAQLGDLLNQMDIIDPLRALEARVLAFTGMRVGELYGLHWDDIGTETITVRHSASAGVMTDTKTHAAREVYLPAFLLEALENHHMWLKESNHPGFSSNLVFPSDKGTPRYPSYLSKLLQEGAALAGIDIHVTPQVLRRTFNTLLVSAGVDRIVLRSQMGHTTEAMTERYAGVPLEAKKAAFKTVFEA